MAHPTALYENGEMHVWFKAHDSAGPSGAGYAHGNVNVLTTEERTAQLIERTVTLEEQQTVAVSPLDDTLAAYQASLRTQRSVLARTSHDALMAAHDLDREIHWTRIAIRDGDTPSTGPVKAKGNKFLDTMETDLDNSDVATVFDETVDFIAALDDNQNAIDTITTQTQQTETSLQGRQRPQPDQARVHRVHRVDLGPGRHQAAHLQVEPA